MTGFGNIVQKALYLGIGIASYAGEKAGVKLQELRAQAQKIADEMVARGEMTTEEARKFVDDLVQQAQTQTVNPTPPTGETQNRKPRQIEIVSDDEETQTPSGESKEVDNLRQQAESLQEQLRKLRNE